MRRYDFVNGLFGGFWALALMFAVAFCSVFVALAVMAARTPHSAEEGEVGWSPAAMFHAWGLLENTGIILTLAILVSIFLVGFWLGQKILRDRPQLTSGVSHKK